MAADVAEEPLGPERARGPRPPCSRRRRRRGPWRPGSLPAPPGRSPPAMRRDLATRWAPGAESASIARRLALALKFPEPSNPRPTEQARARWANINPLNLDPPYECTPRAPKMLPKSSKNARKTTLRRTGKRPRPCETTERIRENHSHEHFWTILPGTGPVNIETNLTHIGRVWPKSGGVEANVGPKSARHLTARAEIPPKMLAGPIFEYLSGFPCLSAHPSIGE